MKRVSLFLFVLVIPILLFAQSNAQFGLKAGLNYVNNVLVSKDLDVSGGNAYYRFSYHFGGESTFELSEKLTINPELIFSSKGFAFREIPYATPTGDGIVVINYANFPLTIGYTIINKLTLQSGIETGYILSARSKFDSETIDVGYIWDKKFDFGIVAGLRYTPLKNWAIGFRYTHGLYSLIDAVVANSVGVVQDGTVKWQNRTFQLSLSYILRKKISE